MASQTIELFRDLDAAQSAALMTITQRVRLSAGDILFHLGDDAAWLYSIEWGRISLSLPMRVRHRDEDVLVEERLPGQTFGWSAVIPPHRATLTATALAATELLAIPRDPLLELFEAQPKLAYLLTRSVATVVGHRLQVLQAMWLREIQRVVQMKVAAQGAAS
jgi:CRP-like cAMP-binding protein